MVHVMPRTSWGKVPGCKSSGKFLGENLWESFWVKIFWKVFLLGGVLGLWRGLGKAGPKPRCLERPGLGCVPSGPTLVPECPLGLPERLMFTSGVSCLREAACFKHVLFGFASVCRPHPFGSGQAFVLNPSALGE